MQIIRWILSLFKHKPTPPTPVVTLSGGPTIAIINASTVLTDTEIAPVVQALQVQVSRDFMPLWNENASLVQIPRGGKPAAGSWWMVLMDNSDVASALGYHDLTSEGLPIMKVFVKTCMDDGEAWTVCASHELLEALGDSNIDLAAQVGEQVFYCYENCDACEGDDLGYDINGIRVSDFVTKAWWNQNAPAGTRFDFMGHLSKPLEIAPGGYIGAWSPSTGWGQVLADKATNKTMLASRGRVGSRRERRRIPKSQWVRSTAH